MRTAIVRWFLGVLAVGVAVTLLVVVNGVVSGDGTQAATEPCADTEEGPEPCEPRDVRGFALFTGSSGDAADSGPVNVASVESVLEEGLRQA